jgi:hypothetical protein
MAPPPLPHQPLHQRQLLPGVRVVGVAALQQPPATQPQVRVGGAQGLPHQQPVRRGVDTDVRQTRRRVLSPKRKGQRLRGLRRQLRHTDGDGVAPRPSPRG